jgi:pyridinium-3,5-biscarboxylic acid mononucleotide synthase
MDKHEIEQMLEKVKNGQESIESATEHFQNSLYKDLDFAKIDYHRKKRVGYPEVIYCEGKELEHLKAIVSDMLKRDVNILATRVNEEAYRAICEITDKVTYSKVARICVINPKSINKIGKIAVVTGGTADVPVAEEAALTCEVFGNNVERFYDVGVAGIHRLFSKLEEIRTANVIIAVAGMEGALASVIAGLVDVPVVAVPTSIGYGSNFKGLSALLTMLNSCAAGIGVMNIDNGFGGGYLASQINKGFSKNGGDVNENTIL